MISSVLCHADTILDHTLTQMDEKVISDKMLHKAVANLIPTTASLYKRKGDDLISHPLSVIV